MASKIVVNLDTSKENFLIEKCVQGDDITIEANIFENGVIKDLANHGVVINVLKPDGTYVVETVEVAGITGNKITKLMNKQTTTAYGIGKVMITLTDANTLQNSTFEFKLDIKKFVTEGAIASGTAVPIVQELTQKITEATKVKNDTEALIQGGGAATKAELDAKPDGVSVYTGTNGNALATTGANVGKKDDMFVAKNGDVFIKTDNATWGNKIGTIPTEIVNDLITDSADGGDDKGLSATQGVVLNNKMYSRAVHPVRNIVSFYLDDAPLTDYTKIKPIAEAKGVPFTVGVIADAIPADPNTPTTQMSLNQLLELQNNLGWDMHSHCLTNVDLSTMTRDQQEIQLRDSKRKLIDMGLKAESILYPQGYYNADTMELARKYYRAGFSSNLYGWVENKCPIRTFDIGRIILEGDTYPINDIKSWIDKMNNQWYVFYCHSESMTEADFTKLEQLIDYVKTKSSIEIMTCSKALDVFENRLDIGDIGEWRNNQGLQTTQKNQYFKIGADGTLESNPALVSIFGGRYSGITNATPITNFKQDKITTTSFNATEKSGIPFPVEYEDGKGMLVTTPADGVGTLVTYRLHEDDALSFQEFYDLNHTLSARRTWKTGTNTWGDWVKFSSDDILEANILPRDKSSTTIKSTTPITHFPQDRVHYATFLQGSGAGMPSDNSIGTLITHRLGEGDNLSYQTWKGYNSHQIYTRHWIGGAVNNWSDWDTAYRLKHTTEKHSFGLINANGNIVKDFTVTGLQLHGTITHTFSTELPTGVVSECSCPTINTLRVKIYNLTSQQQQIGDRTIYVIQDYFKN